MHEEKKMIFFNLSILLLESLRSFLILRFMKENEMKNNFSLLFFTFNIVIYLYCYILIVMSIMWLCDLTKKSLDLN